MHLWMCVQAMNVLHLNLRDISTDSSENSAELIVKQAELSSLIWLVPRQYTINLTGQCRGILIHWTANFSLTLIGII